MLFVLLVLLASLPRVASAQPAPYLFVPTQDGFSFVDPVTNTVTGTVTGVCSFTLAVASPDGRRVYCTTGGAMKVLDVGRRALVTSIPLPFNVSDGTITPDGSSIWLADFGGQAVHVIDTTTNTIVANIPVGFLANGVAISPDGQRAFVVGNGSSAMTIIDIATRSVVGSIPLSASGEHIAVHPDGHKAYVTLYLSNRLSVVDLDTVTEQTTVTFDQFPWDVAVSPDGSTLYVTGRDGSRLTGGTVRVLSTATNTVTTTIQGGGFPGAVRFTPDGSRAYVAYLNSSSTTTAIDTATNTMLGDIATGYNPGVIAMGPPIIRSDCPCAPTVAFDDAALTALHFGKYVPMFGGTLTIRSTTTLNRTFSLLSVAGATPTQSILAVSSPFTVTIPGVIGEGTFVKDHDGKVSLAGAATQAGGTRVQGGTLQMLGQHPGLMTLLPNTVLQGTGPLGTIDASAGGWIAPDTTMHAANVTFGANSQLLISDLDSPNYSRFDVTGTAAINGAGLYFSGVQSQNVVAGKAWSLLTHTTGAFAGEPEGFTFPINQGLKFRYTYRGGSGSDLMLLVDSPPAPAPIGDRTIAQDGTLGPVPLTVTDDFTTAANLKITATSSNPALVPNANLAIGAGATRTLTATPLFGTSGQTTITVTVTDEAAWQVTQTFVLTVSPTRSYYLAEGATGGFFTTDILLANPNTVAAPITVSFHKDDGQVVSREMTLPGTSRTTVRVNDLDGMASAAFSTTVVSTSGVPLVVERTMWWDATGYGASTEKAGQQSAQTWYFAEGAQGYFHTYFLLFNPNVTATVAHMTYLMEDGPPIQRDVPMPAGTRVTLDAGDQPELQNRAFGTRVDFDLPGLAERAMYFGTTPLYAGGAAAAGVPAPAKTWYLAEGVTGSFFQTFVLIANPNDQPATLTITYLPEAGTPISKTRTLAAHQRATINVATEDPLLTSAVVSTRVDADVPVTVERSTYWPADSWYESHASAAETTPGLRWGLAEGRVGGSAQAQTFILVANPGDTPADLTVTFLRADGTTLVKTFTARAASRFTLPINGDPAGPVPELTNESFGAIVSSTQPVLVERSLYTSAGGVLWTAGTHSAGTPLEP